ncbi:hypothetical protein GPECTOR_86g369 [Gonium pectorale]|uniref:C2 domain-containing protein n=1 Tax=Gonium pectorale TaxID=33097 RepID=A0A150G125_GONPE|nr:hypothetical protein GPECTOR_86g369 [Gonium pectorale]|eukprot:KXZ43576.1 hypothetical protein GPECTOR_86g369 [Gonium pectorale]
MALEAGEMSLTVEYAKDLKDKDWFGKQDPYAMVRVGNQQFRTRTATDGGKNPVWNETFRFNIINENDAELIIKDDDVASHDDYIGTCRVNFAKAREYGRDTVQLPVSSKHGKQHGFVQVTLMFTRNSALKAGGHGGYGYPTQYGGQQTYAQAIPGYGVPAPAYGAPPAYGASPAYGAPPAYGAYPPPGGAGYPQPQYGAPPPAYGAPPQQYPPAQYGAPPPYGAYPGYPPR